MGIEMSAYETKQLARAIVKEIEDEHGIFWIDPKTHYDCHAKFNSWVVFFEKCKEDCGKLGRRLFVIGGFSVISYGIYVVVHIK